ncbi:MAG: putative metal-binding motif-containing protein [Deltaproteobacteria bacterium]|nr:putative metal-binding motif-containing protein [Deltaproteobacteria bacterium]MBW2080139.1 putative metal-binding motif-containing protein [Deltaproteobacteria bacterium]
MAWLNRCLHILLKPSSREKGAVSLLLLGALAVGCLFYEAYSNDLLPNLDKYRQYAQDVASDNPENADPNALHDALEATKNTLAPSRTPIYTQPWDPGAWLEYLLYGQVIEAVEIGINTPTPDPGGRGRPGQPVACSLSVEPGLAAPGEFVTVNLTVPTIFKSRITGISGSAGVAGFSIPPSGGSAAFSIPAGICEQTLPISCEAYGPEGTVFSGSTSVKVDFSGLPDFDHDGIVDRCDPDDDNDGSPDSADCAPLDPNRFPGNQEICEDGIDQDCDGEDKPCETPGCDPPACCPEYPINCGDYCCSADFPICCGDGTCCPAGTVCCGDWCCPAGTFCRDGYCIPDGSVYCGNGNSCPAGTFCCSNQPSCCPVGTTCTGDGHCE